MLKPTIILCPVFSEKKTVYSNVKVSGSRTILTG